MNGEKTRWAMWITDADWVKHTVIPHTCQVVSLSKNGKILKLKDTLADGVIVHHTITAKNGEVDFRIVAHNPTKTRSEAPERSRYGLMPPAWNG